MYLDNASKRTFDTSTVAGGAQRIVVVLHDLALGGTERIAIRLANRWASLGRDVTIFCGAREGALADLVEPQVRVAPCDPPIRRAPGSRRRLGAAAAAFVAADRPDAVFVPGNFHWPVVAAINRLQARPVVVAQISSPLRKTSRGPLRRFFYDLRVRAQLRGADGAVSLSPQMTAHADTVLGRQITQCIRLPALQDENGSLQAATGKVIVAIGRLAPEKGFDVALRAFALLSDSEARLVIVGDGPVRAELANLALDLGIGDRVQFPGYIADVRPWLRRSRAFLLSSHHEGYSAAIVEALAEGRPVIATACTPATDELLISDAAGRTSPVGDVVALAECMSKVLSAPAPDPDRLAAAVAGYRIGPISAAYLRMFDRLHLDRLIHEERRVSVCRMAPPQTTRAPPSGGGNGASSIATWVGLRTLGFMFGARQ